MQFLLHSSQPEAHWFLQKRNILSRIIYENTTKQKAKHNHKPVKRDLSVSL